LAFPTRHLSVLDNFHFPVEKITAEKQNKKPLFFEADSFGSLTLTNPFIHNLLT